MSADTVARVRYALTRKEAVEVVQLFEDAVFAIIRHEADAGARYVAARSELIDNLTGV